MFLIVFLNNSDQGLAGFVKVCVCVGGGGGVIPRRQQNFSILFSIALRGFELKKSTIKSFYRHNNFLAYKNLFVYFCL